MLQYNIEATLQFPDSTSGLLVELRRENKVLTRQWKRMLAEFNPPVRQFVLSLDEAKARNAAAKTAAQASEPQLGNLADQLNSADNFLNLEHTANGTFRQNPGEVVALIKTMEELDGLGYEVDWVTSTRILLPSCLY
jgi:hypothetical protein